MIVGISFLSIGKMNLPILCSSEVQTSTFRTEIMYVAIQLFFAKQGQQDNERKLRDRVKNDSAFHALFSPSCQLQLAWMDFVESTPEFAVAYDILLLLTFAE